MPFLPGIERWLELPNDNLTQPLERLLTSRFGEFLPEVVEHDLRNLEKGGVRESSCRMSLLLENGHGTVAASPPSRAERRERLPGNPGIVETVPDHGHCDCLVCGDTYEVETDAFGDGCMTYHVPLVAERLLGSVRDED